MRRWGIWRGGGDPPRPGEHPPRPLAGGGAAPTLDAYDQREAQTEGQNKLQDNPVLRRKLTQLKLTEGI